MDKSVINITVDDLDPSLKRDIAQHLFYTVQLKAGTFPVPDDELKSILMSGLTEDLKGIIREYYEFLGQVDINLSVSEVMSIYNSVTT